MRAGSLETEPWLGKTSADARPSSQTMAWVSAGCGRLPVTQYPGVVEKQMTPRHC